MSSVPPDLFSAVVTAATPEARWTALTRGLAAIGLDQINYAFLDFQTYDRMEARGDPAMSTMRADWIEYYAAQRYDLDDEIVAHVRAGRFDPQFYRLSRDDQFAHREMAEEAREAGLQAGLLVPLPGPLGDVLPAAGIVLGSSLGEDETARIVSANGPALIALAHVLHTGLSGELMRRRAGAAVLTARERECLQRVAQGRRTAQIADALSLAEVTIALHLRNARRKLGARNLPEAVAKAMLYQQIEIG